jgi:GntP family gluconate:H+ symporter
MADFTTIGAAAGLAIAIILIIQKVHPAYSLILGALIGGLIGGGGPAATVNAMISGAQDMMSPVLRILTSGILTGALIRTGSARKIAETIVGKMGEHLALAAIALATMIICAAGVFVDISVITVAPVALAIGQKAKLNKNALLLAMIGGGKAGNIVSPNPNTIATAEAFGTDLTSLMIKNIVPAVFALGMSVFLSFILSKKQNAPAEAPNDMENSDASLPGFIPAVIGPMAVILLLALRPIAGVSIDPMIALPLGGLICMIVTGKAKEVVSITEFGLSKVIGVAVLLVGTGTIAGIIKASALQYDVISLLERFSLPAFVLAPLAGVLMAGATASTTAGTTIAAQTFASTLLSQGVPALAAGAMIHAGATVADSLPHGSFFHATGGSVNFSISERMKLIPFEACVGLTATIISAAMYLLFG